jgi:hypothetical protein
MWVPNAFLLVAMLSRVFSIFRTVLKNVPPIFGRVEKEIHAVTKQPET